MNVNYRHTPDHPHPTQINDAWDAFVWLSTHIDSIGGDKSKVVVGGVSAGGCLAASTVLRQHQSSKNATQAVDLKIKGMLLMSPWLLHPSANPHLNNSHSSYKQNEHAAVLPWTMLRLFSDLLGPAAVTDPWFNVGLVDSKELKGMPKSAVLITGQDALRDEGLEFAERLKNQGVPTKVHIFPGLPHGFRRFKALPSVKRWEELISECVAWCVGEDEGDVFEIERVG